MIKYIQAFKDSTGFHFVVEISGKKGQTIEKRFNYGPAPGAVVKEVAGPAEGPPTVLEHTPETEDEYVTRIRAELEKTCTDFADTWLKANGEHPSQEPTKDLGLGGTEIKAGKEIKAGG